LVDTQSAFAVVGFAVPTVIPETHSFGINGAEVARGCIITHAATLALVATQGSCFKGRLTFIGFLKRTLTFFSGSLEYRPCTVGLRHLPFDDVIFQNLVEAKGWAHTCMRACSHFANVKLPSSGSFESRPCAVSPRHLPFDDVILQNSVEGAGWGHTCLRACLHVMASLPE
jgi:hypothetical protein